MLLGLLFKNWRRILDALLLIAIIVFIFLWNPFNIFGGGLKLQNTANLVSNVRSIGQLVTAEYYGEVVASLDEARLNIIEEDNLQEWAEDFYIELKRRAFEHYNSAIISIYDREEIRKNPKQVKNSIGKAIDSTIDGYGKYPEKFKRDSADVVLLFLAKYVFNENIKVEKYRKYNKKKRVKLREKQLENLFYHVKKMYETLSEDQFNDFLNQGFETTTNYTDFYYEFKESQKTRKEKKQKLAMIGRGWVKAGFDFGKLDERRFSYDKDTKTIHLFGIRAQILDTDINPWFIPERKVPGFDIIMANNVNFEHAKEVKLYCKRKLLTYAMEAQILEQAKDYGETAIKEFFTLLTGDDIRNVRFHTDELFTVYSQVSSDSQITIDELPLIDSTYVNYLQSIKSSENEKAVAEKKNDLLTQFLSDLKKLPFEFQGTKIPFNYFTRNLLKVLQDSVIDMEEYNYLSDTLRLKIKITDWEKFKKDTSVWKVEQDSSLSWKVDNDTLWSKFKKDSLQWKVKRDTLWWKKADPIFVPDEYRQARHWFHDSLAFIEDYDTLINALIRLNKGMFDIAPDTIRGLQSGSNAFNDTLRQLASLTEAKKVLNYTVVGNEIYVQKIKSIFPDSVVSAKLNALYYNLNTNQDALTKIIKSDVFNVQETDLKAEIDLKEVTTLQERELEAYHLFVFRQHQIDKERPWVVKASEQFRERFLDKEKIQSFGNTIKGNMRGLLQRF